MTMRMRSAMILALAAALLAGRPATARAYDAGRDAGLALGAAALDLVYTPCKMVMAISGLVAGGIVGTLTGGDTRAAYALWVPAAGGTYMVTPAILDGSKPLEFFGSDYADQPSPVARTMESSSIYSALYK